MFLLFFLMVAAGMLSLLWIYFPMQGGPPQEPVRAPVTVPAPAAANSADTPLLPGVPLTPDQIPAAGNEPTATAPTAASTAATSEGAPPALPPLVTPAAPGVSGATGAAPSPITVEELDRELERLLGNAPVSPPARPPTRP